MMKHWEITLDGEEPELKFIETLLSNTPLAISNVDGRRVLSLPDVPLSAEKEDAQARAEDLIESLNGAARLLRIVFRGLSIASVLRSNDDGGRTGIITIQAPARPQRNLEVQAEDTILADWVALAQVESEVARALYLFGSMPPNWKNLYMVYEVVEQEFGGETRLIKGNLCDEKQLKLFKQTANSYAALGRDARHAKNRELPPANPMSLASAQEFVMGLVKGWIAGKHNASR